MRKQLELEAEFGCVDLVQHACAFLHCQVDAALHLTVLDVVVLPASSRDFPLAMKIGGAMSPAGSAHATSAGDLQCMNNADADKLQLRNGV